MRASIIYIGIISIFMSCQNATQAQMEGNYTGEINGAIITLSLQKQSKDMYVGTMQDEQQTYVITAQKEGNCLKGNAVENNLQINIIVSGCLQNNQIDMSFDFSNVGLAQTQNVVFTKNGSQNATVVSNPKTATTQKSSNTERDLNVVGVWKQEQLYNSGSGDGFFGGSFTQKVVFYTDGGIADGGSQATMSGSDYSGSSSSGYGNKAPGVSWSTKNKHLFITVTQNGQTQTVDVGKYYVENGKMLITSQNGAKTLLLKVQ
ncbi:MULTISPECIES: hypothetical protein [unclassified Flavobacterium]|uniref:hypothetical protein n=1 Tax=unclassified Flavobacterium TaxID=196869 RepID=UPI0020901429|nr:MULTISPECIES: hypothetical protein [unclassified Flavobacterium]MCO6163278.1 hypothetical protein [Flavobacterium sp. NRK F7]